MRKVSRWRNGDRSIPVCKVLKAFPIIMNDIELTLVEARSSVQALGYKDPAKLGRADSWTPVMWLI